MVSRSIQAVQQCFPMLYYPSWKSFIHVLLYYAMSHPSSFYSSDVYLYTKIDCIGKRRIENAPELYVSPKFLTTFS